MIAQIKQIAQNVNGPEMQMVRQITSGRGISAKQAVESICREKGIDVNAFMTQIQGAFAGH